MAGLVRFFWNVLDIIASLSGSFGLGQRPTGVFEDPETRRRRGRRIRSGHLSDIGRE